MARLSAMIDALNIVHPKLKDFFASLNDEQKAKFNTIGPAPETSSQPVSRPEQRGLTKRAAVLRQTCLTVQEGLALRIDTREAA